MMRLRVRRSRVVVNIEPSRSRHVSQPLMVVRPRRLRIGGRTLRLLLRRQVLKPLDLVVRHPAVLQRVRRVPIAMLDRRTAE
ncbi:hypothetical protein DB728_29355 [Rhizobium leguminosarum bv. viciae USDA 2370]|nr:hypothetical protein CHR56_37430 [Rhizobium leguminosarum bv. viciae]OOO53964.1 hypothetical protein BS629_04690 [Rhizobium leguminosarum bv. viciae USDA 2370]PUB61063.1 hypothetical protein DB728_29355 [Rhizobium leguminosarum bv. viciae USDA 2370]